MQEKHIPLIQLLIFVFSLTFLGGIGIAGDQETLTDNGPAEIILKTHAATKPARFPHEKHQKTFECGKCHHSSSDDGIKYPYVRGMKIKKCVTCHNKDDMSNPRLNNFKLTAHGLCKG